MQVGLKIVEKHQDIKLIISDHRMPIMSGSEFLQIVSEKYPDVIRVILTAYTDIEVVKEAINSGQVYRFLNKPWNKEELTVTINNAIEAYNLRIENYRLVNDLESANDKLTSINQNLEDLVNKRTIELQQSNEELESINEELLATNEELDNSNEKLESVNLELNSAVDELNIINKQLLEEIKNRQIAEAELKKYQNQLEELVKIRTLALKESEKQLRNVSDNIPNGAIIRAFINDENLILKYVSANFYKITGNKILSTDKLTQFNLLNKIHSDYLTEFKQKIKETKKNLSLFDFEIKYNKNTNKYIWLHFRMMPHINNNGDIIFDGLITDISNRKGTEELILRSEIKFRNLFNNTANGIVIINFQSQIIELNKSILQDTYYKRTELLNTNVMTLISPPYQNSAKEIILKLKSSIKVKTSEMEIVTKKRTFIPFEVSSKLIDYDGQPAILCIFINISERKQMDRKLLETIIKTEERERERFAQNLHDDIGPLLSSIKLYSSSLNDTTDIKKQKYIVEKINEIVKESIQSTKEISNDLSPHILVNYGLEAALTSYINQLTNSIEINFTCNLKKTRLTENIEMNFYRIIKELINNTIKHAHAKQIIINLTQDNNVLSLLYEDNGIGLKHKNVEKYGMGFFNIENRIKALNGKSKFHKTQNNGFGFELIAETN